MSARSGPGLLPSQLTPRQAALVESPVGSPPSLFLEGPAGAGKTTAGVARLLRLLQAGVAADTVLVIVPQRTLARVYLEALQGPSAPAGTRVDVLTIGGLARRAVDLFWPLVAGPAGFAHPDRPPVFLTLETAQYYMDRLIEPFIAAGAFGDVTLARQRLISQVLDNLNKAAIAGFSHREIGERLSQAWSGESSRLRVYEQVQACATAFRDLCLKHNLLDFSLQVETFARYVVPLPPAEALLVGHYRHLIADNIEEDVPVTHDLLARLLAGCDSAWLIYDEQGGLRTYLGADPAGAYALHERCAARERWGERQACAPCLVMLETAFARSLGFDLRPALAASAPAADGAAGPPAATPEGADILSAVTLLSETYHTQAIESVAGEVARLVHEQGVPPDEIAVLAPFMGDALRFALSSALARQGIATWSQRPSRALRDEPAARCLLVLARLAHPAWQLPPLRADVACALTAAIEGMDLVRATHLAAIVYRGPGRQADLVPFERIRAEEQAKITYLLGNRYDDLRRWLAGYTEGPAMPLDHFWSRLFDEVLSRPGYTFHHDRDAAAVAAHLIDSAQKFRQTVAGEGAEAAAAAPSFVLLVEQGVIAAQYLPPQAQASGAVLLAPAYTFVMAGRPVDYQFWLDLASPAWGRRLYQPLTHPHVLTRRWPAGQRWTDADEDLANRQALYRLVLGLIRRCRTHIYLVDSVYNERGFEERGALQQALFRALRQAAREGEGRDG